MTNDRPYTEHLVSSADATRDFMAWLQKIGEADSDPTGVAVNADTITLAQDEDLYAIPTDESGYFARAALAAAFMGGSPPRLVAVDAAYTLTLLTASLTGHYPRRDLFNRLSACMIGDLNGAAYTSGHAAPAAKLSPEDEAYTARLLEPQYQTECPGYYVAVTLPLVRLRAEWAIFGRNLNPPPSWWISYPDLWLRTLHFYTSDPTLGWIFNEGHDALGGLARLFEWAPDLTKAVLVWHICGRSVDVMADVAPALIPQLPDNLPEIGDLWNRRLPSLWLGITNLMQSYQRDRLAKTRYGRKLRGGAHPGAASAHVIFGTVRDLVEIATVTIHNNRPDESVLIRDVDSDPLAGVLRITGTGPTDKGEQERWIETLSQLAPLANPLSVGLEPTVVQPPAEAPAKEGSHLSSGGSPATSPTTPNLPPAGSILGRTTANTPTPRRTRRTKSSVAPRRSRATSVAPCSESLPASNHPKSSRTRK